MQTPTHARIADFVLSVLSLWSSIPVANLGFYQSLRDDLDLDDHGFRTLAGALRSYVQRYDGGATIRVEEVKRAEQIGSLISLVVSRLTGRVPETRRLQGIVEKIVNG